MSKLHLVSVTLAVISIIVFIPLSIGIFGIINIAYIKALCVILGLTMISSSIIRIIDVLLKKKNNRK